MDTIDQLMRAGDDLMKRIIIPGETKWQAEAENIPEDAYPEEDAVQTLEVDPDDDDDDDDDQILNREMETEDETFPDYLTKALSADLQPLGKALAGALQAGDEAAMQAALRKISEQMPEFLESSELEAALGGEFLKSLTEP